MRIKKIKSVICNDEGSAIGVFVVILLSMTFLATASITLAQTQYSWSRFSRQTSNSYHLARSGAEKVVDNMNKEVAKVLPDLMKEASDLAHTKLMGTGTDDGVKYKGTDAYTGKYMGAQYENEYERQLKELVYNHIIEIFITNPVLTSTDQDYRATKSDLKDPIEINVKTNIFKHGDILPANYEGRNSIMGAIGKLGTITQIKETPHTDKAPDAFVVEVTALAKDGPKSSLTKSKVVGSIGLDKMLKNEELREEYEWAEAYPEIFQSAVLSFGDFIVNGSYKNTTINGDISVKGTKAETNALNQKFPEPDEFGGIVISDGGSLTVDGNALVVNNIQTTNSKGDTTKGSETTLHIKKDAIAETIAINDNALESDEPWGTLVSNNKIRIDRNVYMENDLRIGRYVKGGQIVVGQSVFGISDGDKNGVIDPITHIKYVDPNKSSGIYAMGKLSDDDSKIEMARAFIAGQAYINFGDGKGFHKLHESIGEPFEDVYYLDEYRLGYGEELDKGDGSPKIIGGDSSIYTTDLGDLINKERIKIGKNSAYAPSLISTEDPTSAPANFQAQAKEIFYAGLGGNLQVAEGELTDSSDWDNHILGVTTNPKWREIILNPLNFYSGTNPFKKDYLKGHDLSSLAAYQGLQGYMLGKRGVFYEHFESAGSGTAGLIPKERKFDDLIKVGTFTMPQEWSRNNPIRVITEGTTDVVVEGKTGIKSIDINISDYKDTPTAIVCTNPNVIIKLKSDLGKRDFTGIIVTPGKIIIEDKMTINGVVIAGNEHTDILTPASTKHIRTGIHAGIQIATNEDVVFKYDANQEKDRNMIFDIRFMDKSLQRQLYDCLGMTNYASAPAEEVAPANNDKERIEAIFGPSGNRKVKLSNESVISSNQEGLQLTMTSLQKIKN